MNFLEFCSRYSLRLSSQQMAAVRRREGTTLLMAVPGSGKTTVVTARAAYLIYCCGVPSSEILTITYSRAAAQEMRERYVSRFGGKAAVPAFSTIHSLCLTILHYARQNYGIHIPRLEADSTKITRRALYESTGIWPSDRVISRVTQLVSRARNLMMTQEEVDQLECPVLSDQYTGVTFSRFLSLYDEYKRANNVMDFDDQLTLALEVLEDYEAVRVHFRDMFPHIELDEAQDTSLVQFAILEKLTDGGKSFIAVGDDDQSIYGFRGASPEYIRSFKDHYPDARILYLETNYRSGTELVARAARFIAENQMRYDKKPVAARRETGEIRVHATAGAEEMYWDVADLIRHSAGGGETIAVMARNNYFLLPLVDELAREDIPVRSRDNFGSFFAYPAVSGMLSMLALSREPGNFRYFEGIRGFTRVLIKRELMQRLRIYMETSPCESDRGRIVEAAKRFFPEDSSLHEPLVKAAAALEAIENMNPGDAVSELVKRYVSSSAGGDVSMERYTYPKVLAALASSYSDMDTFLTAMNRYRNGDDRSSEDSCITLTTIHSAKGLEFDRVILLDAFEGILPGNEEMCLTPEGREEEARLFYVALTRARDRFDVYVPATYYGTTVNPSPFLFRLRGYEPPETPKKKEKKKDPAAKAQGDSGREPKKPVEIKPLQPAKGAGRSARRQPVRKPPVWNSSRPQSAQKGPDPVVGDRVKIKAFGEGVVEKVDGKMLYVRLDSGETRKMMNTFCTKI